MEGVGGGWRAWPGCGPWRDQAGSRQSLAPSGLARQPGCDIGLDAAGPSGRTNNCTWVSWDSSPASTAHGDTGRALQRAGAGVDEASRLRSSPRGAARIPYPTQLRSSGAEPREAQLPLPPAGSDRAGGRRDLQRTVRGQARSYRTRVSYTPGRLRSLNVLLLASKVAGPAFLQLPGSEPSPPSSEAGLRQRLLRGWVRSRLGAGR